MSTAVDPLVRERARSGRRAIVVVSLVLVATVLLVWLGSGARQGFLDPEAYDGLGSRAVAALLEDQGVTVVKVRTATDAIDAVGRAGPGNASLLVTNPDLLTEGQVARLATAGAATTVLLAPTSADVLSTWAPGVSPAAAATNDVREPECTWRAALLAGGARAGGAAYTVPSVDPANPLTAGDPIQGCYPFEGNPTVVRLTSVPSAGVSEPGASTDVTILGDPLILTNDQLAKDGNAALALNSLGERTTLVWYLPSLAELEAGAQKSFFDLVPPAIPFALLQLFVAVVLLALWRARRLGPVVVEPIPVAVRSSETVEGRGRLYRRAKAHDRAADALRAGTIDRLRRRTGLPARSTPDMIVAATASRSSRTDVAIRDLLYGAPPTDDAALVRLADALDSLEREVTST